MTVSLFVNPLHFPAEELAVRGGVTQMVNGDIVMNHLMKDCIPDEFFGKIETRVDPEFEVRIRPFSKEPLPALDESEFAEKSAGVTEFNRNRRQCAVEETDVILVKTGLYIVNGGPQWSD